VHISEGVLSGPVLLAGAALAAAGTAVGLKGLDYERLARAGMLSACFFVASLIHVPIGPSSAHLVLNGLVGLILGWGAFPAILVALVLQAFFFQFGGITTLGVNTVIMALPAVICSLAFRRIVRGSAKGATAGGFACGFISVLLSAAILGAFLIFTREDFLKVSWMIVAANLPVMVVEGIITAFCAAFLLKVKPDILAGSSVYPEGQA